MVINTYLTPIDMFVYAWFHDCNYALINTCTICGYAFFQTKELRQKQITSILLVQ